MCSAVAHSLNTCRHWAHGFKIHFHYCSQLNRAVTYNDFVGWLFEDLFLCVANKHSLHPLLWNEVSDKCYVHQCQNKKHRIVIFHVVLHVTMFNKCCGLTQLIMLNTEYKMPLSLLKTVGLRPSLSDVTQTRPSISALLCHSIKRWGSLNQLLLVLLPPHSQVSL